MSSVDAGPQNLASPLAIIVGLDCITGLQSARILSQRNVPVVGISGRAKHWATRTNACREILVAPLSGRRLMETLTDLARRTPDPRALLVPCTDEAVDYLSRNRHRLPAHHRLALSDHDTIELLMDKVRFAEYARTLGFPVPRTDVLRTRDEAVVAAGLVTFPCVLKPPVKTRYWLSKTSTKAYFVHSGAELLDRYDEVAGWTQKLILQEWVEGEENTLVSCNAYFDQGEALATFTARKLRQWPPQVGTSASGEECRDDEVLDLTKRLFGGLRYTGLAYLEAKRDRRTGQIQIIEPNVGRPTGRSAIAEAGGVELLMTAYSAGLDQPLPMQRHQHYGAARWCDVRRDAQAAVLARRRRALTARQWLRWMRGSKAHAIWSLRDPAPFLADIVGAARSGGRNGLTRRARLNISHTIEVEQEAS